LQRHGDATSSETAQNRRGVIAGRRNPPGAPSFSPHRVFGPTDQGRRIIPFAVSPVRRFAPSLPPPVAFELNIKSYFLFLDSPLQIVSTGGIGCFCQPLFELADLA
jgi:hypothetical protein